MSIQKGEHENEAPRERGMMTMLAGIPPGRRTKWLVVGIWIVLIAAASPFAGRLAELEENNQAAWLPAGAESLAVSELQEEFGGNEVVPAVVVYYRDGGLTEADRRQVEHDRELLGRRFPESPPSPAIASDDGLIVLFSVPLPESDDFTIDAVKAIRETAGGGANGLEVYVTGPGGFTTDLVAVFDGLDTQLLLAAMIVVTVLLLLIYRSPFLWLVPIMAVAAAYQPASAAVYAVAEGFGVTVNGQNLGILPVLVYGVGTNYALLLISRYREALRSYDDQHEAMRVALTKAGPAILASGATSSLGLLCLMTADLASTRSLGPIAAIGIAGALIAMLTLLPAVLVIVGRRVFWPFVPEVGSGGAAAGGAWAGVGRLVSRHPRPIWAGTTALLVVMTLGIINLDTSLAQEDQFRGETESIEGQRLLAASFPAGAGAPTTVIANIEARDAVEAAILAMPGVAAAEQDGETTDLVSFAVTLEAAPEGQAARDLVSELREAVHAVPGGDALVGGQDATALDVQEANARDRMVVIPLVLGVVLIILCMVLRSLVAPLILITTVGLSFAASLGASIVAFEYVFGFAAVDSSMLLLGFVFLVTLGIDYNIFMMTRTRQEAAEVGTFHGTIRGLATTGGVISAAGIVLAATFAVVGILPLVAMAQLGFIVGFGVMLETFVVRSVVVPAITMDVGRRMWWPSALARENWVESSEARLASEQRI